ncbi:MAG TPA: sensor domain-containing diguanylate cyclase [Eubacterium sp.]|nr:sensor domain-containing diguanylate cyclase [Eubacterium sp.]
MEYRTKKHSDNRWRILPLVVLICGIIILHAIVMEVNRIDYEKARTKASLNAVTYADRMINDLNLGAGITYAIEQLLISEDGEVNKFSTIASGMMADYVQSIQLAPDGVVNEIYPEEGNEAGKIDLVNDEKRGAIVRYGIENDIVVMHGPFTLNQGGDGIAIRKPVYLYNEDGERYFWGLVIVIIKAPQIFNNSVNALESFGYDYILSKTESPLSSDYKAIDGSKQELDNPVSYKFGLGGCKWQLDVSPVNGWKNDKNISPVIIGSVIIIVLLEVLVFAFMNMEKQRKKFRKMSLTDGLTGLLNRIGFNEQVEKYLNNNESKKCIAILLDVDNFKFINDVYGHEVGDQVLIQLATDMKKEFPENAVIGRNGGDEFCMLIKDCNEEEAKNLIEGFTMKKRTFQHKGKEYKYSISLGYVEYPTYAHKGSELLRYADIALYEVKLRGKHGCLPYRASYRVSDSKRSQLGFKLNDISNNLPGAFFIYKADKSDEQILYANNEMLRLAGCDDLDDFFEFSGKHFNGLVHPDDFKGVEKRIWEQISISDNKVNDYVRYRMATKSGEYKNVLDYGRLVHSENYGLVFYVLIVDFDFINTSADFEA